MTAHRLARTVFALSVVFTWLSGSAAHGAIDFSTAAIITGESDPRCVAYGSFLKEEIERRTRVAIRRDAHMPESNAPAIVLGVADHYPLPYVLPDGLQIPDRPEGFAVWVDTRRPSAPRIFLVGRDHKGVLFGAGYLLRKLYLAQDFVQANESLRASSAPTFPVRGQQIIVRSQNKERFIDWNDPGHVQQYIRDLALFGNNTIEPTMARDDLVVMADFCEGLDIDLAYTVDCDEIIALNAGSEDAINPWPADIAGIDQFVTYGGDHSGALPPFKTFPAMEHVVPLVLEQHPGATWWYSNQCMGGKQTSHSVDYNDYIFSYLQEKQPAWLHGMIYGPWTRGSIADTRARLPQQYGIRHYPDICHVQWCMYPVPKWDRVWAQVWERAENIYAMPRMMRAVHNANGNDTVGSTSYNHTGTSNDLNKFTFAAMDWNPDTDLMDFLRDYARAFFIYQFSYAEPSPEAIDAAADKVARALLGLEDNWTGPLADNPSPQRCLDDWKDVVALMGVNGG